MTPKKLGTFFLPTPWLIELATTKTYVTVINAVKRSLTTAYLWHSVESVIHYNLLPCAIVNAMASHSERASWLIAAMTTS